MNRTDRTLRRVLISAFAAFVWSTSTHAVVIMPTGDTAGNPSQPVYKVYGLHQGNAFDLTWGGPTGVSATGMVSVDALFAAESLTGPEFIANIRVLITNTSTPNNSTDPFLGPSIVSFGLSIDDFLGFVSSDTPGDTGGSRLRWASTGSIPAFNGHNDVCAYSGSNCSGGAYSGILPFSAHGSDEFNFGVKLQSIDPVVNGLTLDAFSIKIQRGPPIPGTLYPSYELAGVPSLEGVPQPETLDFLWDSSPKTVPEPATLVLLGFSLAGLGRLTGRKRAY